MKLTKLGMGEISTILYENINSNIHLIHPDIDHENEITKFYYGILVRQLYFISDISTLLSNQYVNNLNSIFIIARSILDDFIPLHYIANHPNSEEEIVKLNGEAHGLNLKKIRELADMNEDLLNGEFQHYPTFSTIKAMNERMLNNPNKAKYIADKEKLKFISFKNKRQLIQSYVGKDSRADLYRCYFQWRHLSDYVHYSNFSYEYSAADQDPDLQFKILLEVFIFAYYGSKIAFKELASGLDVEHLNELVFEDLDVEYLTNITKL